MNPYEDLPAKHFWKLGVASQSMFAIENLWTPKFNIQNDDKVSTYGSCFAQHIGQALKKRGYSWLLSEISAEGSNSPLSKKYSYGVFTSRTGNIYTTSLLLQWLKWSFNLESPPDEIWEKNGRFYDPFRPRIEPSGFTSYKELLNSRKITLSSFKSSVLDSNVFIFTLGLTESWFNSKDGYEYPMCPGTIAGEFSIDNHRFINQNFNQVFSALNESIQLMKKFNPELKIILTVSPVPLTATYTDDHVLVATMKSKSILRAVAGEIAEAHDFIDYFPSYEIINSPVFKGSFFEPNQRSVCTYGVNFVMDNFFKCLRTTYSLNKKNMNKTPKSINANETVVKNVAKTKENEVCEEMLLEQFAKEKK